MTDKSKNRKLIFQDYYTDADLDQVLNELPGIADRAHKAALEVMEPTLTEQKEVNKFILDYLRKKKCGKVYGGTAMNAVLGEKGDKIYDECEIADIDFYSPTPIQVLVDLCNELHENGYKYVQGREAQHDESYSIFANMQLYCQISYVPVRVYHGIKTIEVDGIHYVHPHFALIDQLRMFNDPMNSAWRWEKAFKRVYLLLKHYPFEYYNQSLQINKPSGKVSKYIDKIKTDFLSTPDSQNDCLITGFEAYNFFIKHAANDRNAEKMARTTYNTSGNQLLELISQVPFTELITINYTRTVRQMFEFLKGIVEDKKLLTVDEYFPLFQYSNYMVVINYDGEPIVKIYDSEGMCVPNIRTTKKYAYVSFQYLMMFVMINKFRAHLDKNKDMYFNYGILLSNLVKARNIYLTENGLGVINKSVFGEFKISCVGKTVSMLRVSQLRKMERIGKGKNPQFFYIPQRFLDKTTEPPKFDPTKHVFRNTSGNKITNARNLMFKIDDTGNLVEIKDVEEAYSDSNEVKQDAEKNSSPSESSTKSDSDTKSD